MKAIGAIDVGGTKIAVGAVAEDGTLLGSSRRPTFTDRGFAAAMRDAAEMLRELTARLGIELLGVGVACPGPLDPFTGILGDVGTLPGWEGGDIVSELESAFHVPVIVENDADAAALAEAHWGAGQHSRRFVYVTISTGVGAGIVLSGDLYRGVDGAHPEIGHHIVDASGPRCYCGARGCWEALASGLAMAEWMRQQIPAENGWSAARICELARAGDEAARRAVEREAHYIGLGLANLITIFAPDMIAIGGGVMKSADLFLPRVRELLREIVTQVPLEKARLTAPALGDDSGLVGAALSWLQRSPVSYRGVETPHHRSEHVR